MKTSSGNGAPCHHSVWPQGDASGLTQLHRVILLFYPLDFTFVVSNVPRFRHFFLADSFFLAPCTRSAPPSS